MALKCPPWAIPLALVFWGWRCQMPLAAAGLLAVVIPAARVPWRWPLTDRQYFRIGELTTALFLGAIVYGVSLRSETPTVYLLLRWLPVLFTPLLLAQLYSAANDLPLGALFYSMRRQPRARIDFRLPYALVALLAAGGGPTFDAAYFPGVAAFTLWALWRNHPRRLAAPLWLMVFALAVAGGYAGQIGLTRLQGWVEEWSVDWLSHWDAEADPFRARTAMGDLGRLKFSGKIMLRIVTDQPLARTLLLKDAAYDVYQGQGWAASQAGFKPYVPPSLEGPRRLDVLQLQSGHSALLVVPGGWRGLFLPPQTGNLVANRLGALKWQEAPPVLRYRVDYDPTARDPAPPTPRDAELPKAAAEMLRPLVAQLGLERLPPARAAAVVGGFFARDFGYSLDLGAVQGGMAALEDFLYRRHAGHCEYFATATTLLMRAAGVPARFVTGYAVDEYSPAEGAYLARERHAHAWAEAYIDGGWLALDFTPGEWAAREAEADPWWQAWADGWSRWSARFQVWRWEQAQAPEREGMPVWGWLVVPLTAWLAWRLYRSRQRLPTPPEKSAAGPAASVDAAFAALELELVRAGHPGRDQAEPPLRWLRRIGRTDREADVRDYYRRRFGERG